VQRVNAIENLEIKQIEASLRDKIKQLEASYDNSILRLNVIEKLEIKFNQSTLKEQMKKLDELDTYTRTQIKNEIATERVNYVG
jgi:hypothetical protein